MLVYSETKSTFTHQVRDDDIGSIIAQAFLEKTGKRASPSEVSSWINSLQQMSSILSVSELDDDIGVAVELQIPRCAKRIDVTLSGFNDLGQRQVVIVELKQWSNAELTDKDAVVRTTLGKGMREAPHPSYQAWSYAALLNDYNEAVYTTGMGVSACAYLHNYGADNVIRHPFYSEHLAKAPVFLKHAEDKAALRKFIRKHLARGDRGEALYDIVRGRIKPSKQLADAVLGLLQGNAEFVLIDEQKLAYEQAKALVKKAHKGPKQVLIVEGGPGTGKSVVAVNLLATLTGQEQFNGRYVSKNSAPRTVYQQKLVGHPKKGRFSVLFEGSGSYMGLPSNSLDFVVVDEAHRLTEKSGLFGNLGEHQIKELIHASKASIFFIDEAQMVTMQDVGRIATIEQFAAEAGAEVHREALHSQFRCGGSDSYLAWLDNLLGIGVGPSAGAAASSPTKLPHAPEATSHLAADSSTFHIQEPALAATNFFAFEVQVMASAQDLFDEVVQRNADNRARAVAGYCWPWRSKKDPAAMDIEIGPFRKQWNLGSDGSGWIVAPNSVEQIGCIHTCQGLEVDTIGVILGPDLVVRNGVLITNPLARDRHDKSIKGIKKMLKDDPNKAMALADRIIKNTYRTLMTRGMKACLLFSADPETNQWLAEQVALVGPQAADGAKVS